MGKEAPPTKDDVRNAVEVYKRRQSLLEGLRLKHRSIIERLHNAAGKVHIALRKAENLMRQVEISDLPKDEKGNRNWKLSPFTVSDRRASNTGKNLPSVEKIAKCVPRILTIPGVVKSVDSNMLEKLLADGKISPAEFNEIHVDVPRKDTRVVSGVVYPDINLG